jgi:hypothetical protein
MMRIYSIVDFVVTCCNVNTIPFALRVFSNMHVVVGGHCKIVIMDNLVGMLKGA